MKTKMRTALIAGENDAAVRMVQRHLHRLGYIASWTKSAYSVLERIRQDPPDLVVISQDFLAEGGGWILSEQIWEISAGIPVIVHQNGSDELPGDTSPVTGPHAKVREPLDENTLAEAIALAKGESAMK